MKCFFQSVILAIYTLLLVSATGCSFKFKSLYVDLGEAVTALSPPPANVYRIFVDRLGNVYPNWPLPRKAVRAGGSRIDKLFFDSATLRKQLLARYGSSDRASEDTTWQTLQRAVADTIIQQMNKASAAYSTVTVLIHGIGNDINQDNIHLNRNPNAAYQKAEQRITDQLAQLSRKTFFIEIYWDGLHRVKPLDFIGVFSGAQTNSLYAGLGLRNIISHLQTDSLVIITHSLGANVACELLFNQQHSIRHKDRALQPYFDSLYTDTKYHATPPQKSIRLAMIAPAIGGKSTFTDFYRRTGTAVPSGTLKDRYAVWVGYNNKDRIITKHVVAQLRSPLLIRYAGGSTALGGLRGESKRVARLFRKRYPQSSFTAIDFQEGGGDQSPQTAHYFSNYCDNQHFPELIKALYNL